MNSFYIFYLKFKIRRIYNPLYIQVCSAPRLNISSNVNLSTEFTDFNIEFAAWTSLKLYKIGIEPRVSMFKD